MPHTPPEGQAVELTLAGDYTPPPGDSVALGFGVPPPYRAPQGDDVALGLWDWRPPPAGDAVTLNFQPEDAPRPERFPQLGGSVRLDLRGEYTPPQGDAVGLNLGPTYTEPGEPGEPPPPDLPPQRIGMDAGVGSLWTRVKGQQSANRPIRYLHPPLRPVHSGASWQRGKPRPHQTHAPWGQKPPRSRRHAMPWPQELRDATRDHNSPWGILNRRRTRYNAPWQPVERRVPTSVDAHHTSPPPKRIHIHDAWMPVPRWLAPRLNAGYTYPPHKWERWIVPWGEVRGIDNLIRPPRPDEPDPEPEPDDPYYYPPLGDAVLLDLRCARIAYPGDGVVLWFTDAPCPPVPYTPRRTIFVTHSVIITRTEDGQRIPMQGITLSTDMDSWTWDARGTPLGATALAHLQHTAQGPRELNVEIDGIDWRILAEDTSDEERWGQRSRSLQGRGIAAHLAAPYATPTSGAPDNDRTAQQIAADLLEFTGWTLDWQTVDWLVPGGAFSYQDQTPIALISQVAAAVGAFAQAHRHDQTIRVRPRYPISPWHWAEATPDAIIPGSLVKRRAASWDERPAYNRAWVAGRTGGVLVGTTRTGTAGDRAAPQVVDPLITHVDAGRERGRIILANAGRASRVALDTPLLPPPDGPGLILPGHLVEVQEYSGTWRGLAKAVTITATKASVTQSIEIERRFP